MARKVGDLNKSTLLRRDNLISAVEVCRQGNISPPEILREGMLLIRNIALAPVSGAKDIEAQKALINSLPEVVRDKLVKRIVAACHIAGMLMEYGYPKLARVEHTGADGGAIEAGMTIRHEVVYVDPEPSDLNEIEYILPN